MTATRVSRAGGPSRETLAWVERSLGPSATVVAARRLTGGISSSVHRLSVTTNGAAERTTVVLRRWLPSSAEDAAWARATVERERTILCGLADTAIPAPTAIAATDGSDAGGVPALLMTRAPGRMHLAPRQPHEWLGQVAAMLARIHAAPLDAPRWRYGRDPERLAVPQWSARPDVWRAAIEVARQCPREWPETFTHGDYQHFNLLWVRERLTSVVDWTFAAHGPRGKDVGHCRLNLAVLFSPEWAEEFLRAYEAETGCAVDPRWDILALLSYDDGWKDFIPLQVGNRALLDLGGMHRRVENTLAAAVGRL